MPTDTLLSILIWRNCSRGVTNRRARALTKHSQETARHRRHRRTPAAIGRAHYVGPWRLTVVASVIEDRRAGRLGHANRPSSIRSPCYIALRPARRACPPDAPNSFGRRSGVARGPAAAEDANLEGQVYREVGIIR